MAIDPLAMLLGSSTRWSGWRAGWVADPDSDVELSYVALGALAEEAVRRSVQGKVDDLAELFERLEVALEPPDPKVRELFTLGLLESMQNRFSADSHGIDVALSTIGPRALRLWKALDATWDRKANWRAMEEEFRRR